MNAALRFLETLALMALALLVARSLEGYMPALIAIVLLGSLVGRFLNTEVRHES